jgi:hypothetical protein
MRSKKTTLSDKLSLMMVWNRGNQDALKACDLASDPVNWTWPTMGISKGTGVAWIGDGVPANAKLKAPRHGNEAAKAKSLYMS